MRPKAFTKGEILDAMDKTKSVKAACRYLGCSYQHLKRVMKMYTDEATGKTLFEIHKNQCGKGVPKFLSSKGKEPPILSILDGTLEASTFHPEKLKYRLIEGGHLKEECSNCGFHERRLTDYKIPLILNFKDKNKKNWTRNNIHMLCYNCYFLFVAEVFNDAELEQLESTRTLFKTTEAIDFQLDDYQKKRLEEIGLLDKPEKNNDDPYSLVSYSK
jgi:hypothetical protein